MILASSTGPTLLTPTTLTGVKRATPFDADDPEGWATGCLPNVKIDVTSADEIAAVIIFTLVRL
jgi:hypothetical protein